MLEFKNKKIFVTGSCGTVGSELVRQLLEDSRYSPDEVIGIDNNEAGIFFQDQKYLRDERAKFFVLDIRNKEELAAKVQGCDILFHCAALKHVILCERSPDQAVQTNINGVQNIIYAAKQNDIERVIFTSSDKAVNPTNVMGTSKLMGERLITAANSTKRNGGPVFASTRFGNVLGSSGSVIPIFKNQILNGKPVTITDKDMTRFVMSVNQAVNLVIDSALKAKGGEVFITKMPVVKIIDLADALYEMLLGANVDPASKSVEFIGMKPGEKLYEELMSDEETRRAIELENYFVVLPAFRGIYQSIDYDYKGKIRDQVTNPYNSSVEDNVSMETVKDLIEMSECLQDETTVATERYWPGDKEAMK